jgi:hypothetical protein
MNKVNESAAAAAAAAAKENKEEATRAILLLKTLEDMLHNRIKQKKEEVHKTKNIAENDRISTEIETLHWVLAKSLSIRRLLIGQESELSYDTTTTKRLME